MPYVSKAQARKFHADPKLRKLAPEWDAATKKAGGFGRLPQRKGKPVAKKTGASFAGRKPPSAGKKGKNVNMKKTAGKGSAAPRKASTGLSGSVGKTMPGKLKNTKKAGLNKGRKGKGATY